MTVRWLATLGLVLTPQLFLGAVPAPAAPALRPWEHAAAQIELSRVRMLTHRLSKQNLLYQLNLSEQQKGRSAETAREIDLAIRSLQNGKPSRAIPVPPTREMRAVLDGLDEAWGPLRALAVASVFDLRRRPNTRDSNDPLLIRHFDDLVTVVDQRAVAAQKLYVRECQAGGQINCEAVVSALASARISEQVVKETVLVLSGINVADHSMALREKQAAMERAMQLASSQELVRLAMSPERGKSGEVMGGLWAEIGGRWKLLSHDVDLALLGRSAEFDVAEMLSEQQRMLTDLERFRFAVRSFANVRRASISASPQ